MSVFFPYCDIMNQRYSIYTFEIYEDIICTKRLLTRLKNTWSNFKFQPTLKIVWTNSKDSMSTSFLPTNAMRNVTATPLAGQMKRNSKTQAIFKKIGVKTKYGRKVDIFRDLN